MRNEQTRKAALQAGRVTYSQEVIEHWPACVTCDHPIRRSVEVPARLGLFRRCACPGVVWRAPITGGPWEQVKVDDLR